MANRMKEDEKNEKIIRGLLKLPANRRCINCNSLGPQYVCTNFWTFICTNCSGLHREFTHRVKSISMAKFTSQEVSALQEGGNERAREIYFKEWDPQRQTAPDSSNLDRLRDFIKHVYVDRRFCGERSVDRPPRPKMGDREDYYENRREDSYRGGSRSPPYDDTYERQNNDRPGSGGRNDERKFRSGYGERSPGYDQDDYRRSPGRFEVVDEKWRGDKPANGNQNRRFEDRGLPDGLPRPEERSPNNKKDATASSPPVIRPVSDVLGADVPPLRVGGPPKLNGIKPPNGSVQVQTAGSSSSRGSSDSLESRKGNFESLIDFDADPEPSVGGAPHQSTPQQAGALDNGRNWASFDVSSTQTAPQMASHAGNLESALAQLSAPVSAPAVSISMLPVAGGQWPGAQLPQQVSQFQTADNWATNPPLTTPVVGIQNNQSWGPTVPNMQVPLTTPSALSFQAVTRPPHVMNVAGLSQPPVEAKPGVRKELPQDLFAALYSSTPASVSGWQTGTNLGIGYGMQYPTVAAIPTFPQPSVSKNPFDFGNEASVTHGPAFPSMASLHGALPNVNNPSASLHTSSYGVPSQWMPPQPSSFPSSASASTYMVHQHPSSTPQQVPNNFFPMGHQGAGVFSSQGTHFGSSSFNQHSVSRNSQMGLPNSIVPSVGGNPFG